MTSSAHRVSPLGSSGCAPNAVSASSAPAQAAQHAESTTASKGVDAAATKTSSAPVLPALVEDALATWPDDDKATAIRAGFAEAVARPVTLRANTLKVTAVRVAQQLHEAGLRFTQPAWYEDAFILDPAVRERAIWELPLYQNGEIYLQSLSSMLPPIVLDPTPGSDVLDMCAAPGGKTSQIAALTDGRAHLTACELRTPRAEKLTHNLEKLGVRNVNIMRVDARRLDTFFSFDHILLDAPCTGTGTLRAGDTRAQKRMTETLLSKATRSQHALLDRALTVLKPGGTLVYSTCSILPQENEEQVTSALTRHRDCELVSLAPPSADAPYDTDDTVGATQDAGDDARGFHLSAHTQAIVDAVAHGDIPTIAGALPETLTVRPSTNFEGFFLALIRKRV